MAQPRDLLRWLRHLQGPGLVVVRGTVVAANGGAGEVWGCAASQLVGWPLHLLLRRQGHRSEARRAGAHAGRAATVCTSAGRRRRVDVHSLVDTRDGVLLSVVPVADERRRRADLAICLDRLRARAAAQVADDDRHRRHVARQVHDHVQQSLAAVTMDLELARAALPANGAHEVAAPLTRALHETAAALAATREIVDGLSPPALGELGLLAALDALVDRHVRATGVQVHRDWQDVEQMAARADGQRAGLVYRVAALSLRRIGSAPGHGPCGLKLARERSSGLRLEVAGARDAVEAAWRRLGSLRDAVEEFGGHLERRHGADGRSRLVLDLDLAAEAVVPRFEDEDAAALLSLFYRLPVGIVQTDVPGQVQRMNPMAAQLLLPVVRPRRFDNLFTALADAVPGLAQRAADAPPAPLKVDFDGAGGRRIHLELHRQPGIGWLALLS